MISEFSEDRKPYITYKDFLNIITLQKLKQQKEDEKDTLDAFVAMGGNEDKSGSIDADLLIDVLKNQFKMTINIEALIKEVDEDDSGKIEYNEFKTLLS
jgi:Ca2+-binding EF-hand superfamily protein